MTMIRFRIQVFPALVIIVYALLAILGCSKDKKQAQKTEDLEKAAPSSRSLIQDTLQAKPLKNPELLQGIVYVSNAYSSPHLALESESGEVYLITGNKQYELSNLQNRKVAVWGYVYEARDIAGTRDTVEVLRYEVIRGEGG